MNMDDADRELEAALREAKDGYERGVLLSFGLPQTRRIKNEEYVAKLVQQFGEPTIRGILKALSVLYRPLAVALLAKHDLTSEPLWKLIGPFEPWGLHLEISVEPTGLLMVKAYRGYLTAGDGAFFEVKRTAPDTFKVLKTLGYWKN